jgi:predicted dehydrogenase
MTVWLVGAGLMASLHADVMVPICRETGEHIVVVANSAQRAEPLAARIAASCITKGLTAALAAAPAPHAAVVALPVDRLAPATVELLDAGVRMILVEKPGGMSSGELANVEEVARRKGSKVYVAYNRRFFASVIEAERRIAAAASISSFIFEFTEDSDRISALPTTSNVKRRWVTANSSHVIDLAFHLCGAPRVLRSHVSDPCEWHSAGTNFRGFGETEAGVSFSYFADWRGPGRWALEIILPNERLILKPLEKLQRVPRGKFEPESVEIDDVLDRQFKPGLWRQMYAFLRGDGAHRLLDLSDHRRRMVDFIEPIAGYQLSGDRS